MASPQNKGRKYEKLREEGEIAMPGSGCGRMKEDTKTPEDLIQKKLTTKNSYSVKLDDLKKLEKEAMMVSRTPRLDLAFDTGGRLSEYVLIPRKVYLRLTDAG